MKNTLHIAQRDLSGFFLSPIAYVVMFFYLLLAGILFTRIQFDPLRPAELRVFFNYNLWLMIIITPALSMRLMSEELRSGTVEPLMTAPVTDTAVIVGKWLGAMGFFAVMLLPTVTYVFVIMIWANPDPGPIASGYVGTLLAGGVYLAIGLLASVLTRNQVIAFIASVFIILLFTVVPFFVSRELPALAGAMAYINIFRHCEDFAKGLIDASDLLYFLTGIAMFLAFAVKALESRKWR